MAGVVVVVVGAREADLWLRMESSQPPWSELQAAAVARSVFVLDFDLRSQFHSNHDKTFNTLTVQGPNSQFHI
jgi:hypothetical protein